MSLAKQITKAFTKMVKDSDRVQKSVDQMKGKLINESLGVIKKAGIDPSSLPFDPIALLNGQIPNPSSLLTPEKVCAVPPLSNSQKNKANLAINKTSQSLSKIIENTNKLKTALTSIQAPLIGIQSTAQTTESLADSISNIIKIIKAIPIPTAFGAPAVALPVKVLTILSSTLIKLDKKVEIAKGTIKLVPPMINQITGILNTTITAVNGVEASIQSALILTSFMKSVIELGDSCGVPEDLYIVVGDVNGNDVVLDRVNGLTIGMSTDDANGTILDVNPSDSSVNFSKFNKLNDGDGLLFNTGGFGISKSDIDIVSNNVNGLLQDALNQSGDFNLLESNQLSEADLIASFPFEYKGFLLELDNNPDNGYTRTINYTVVKDGINTYGEEREEYVEYPFPSRKIRATRDFTGDTGSTGTIFTRGKFQIPVGSVTLYNDPGGLDRYSFSSSVSVLVGEMKFKIDAYLQGVDTTVLPSNTGAVEGNIRTGTPPRGNQQQFTPPTPSTGSSPEIDPKTGLTYGGDDPPSPTGSNTPPLPPAFYFSDSSITGNAVAALPTSPLNVGSFTVVRPIKIKMTTFGGSNAYSDSTAFLRIYKQGGSGQLSYLMEQQFADNMEMVDTGNNPQGFDGTFDFYPINPIYANGTVFDELGVFQYSLELTDFNGDGQGLDNFTTFEIEAQ